MFLTNPFPGAFGLDIGDFSIKLVRLGFIKPPFKEGDFELQDIRTTTLPPGVIVDGEIQQPEIARKKILHLLGRDGTQKMVKSPWVVANLPEPKTFLKLIEVDTPAKELIYEDVAYQAKKHLPFELEETYLDWQVVNPEQTGGKTQVLLAACPKVIADSYTFLLESVGLSPIALEVEAISIVRSMITRNKDYSGMGRVILDVGATRSSLVVFDKNTIQFSTNINFSGHLITEAIEQGLKIDHDDAEKLKITNGLRYDKEHPKYLKIVADLVDKLVDEIKLSLNFYKEHFKNTNPITHITMCGGASALSNMDNILSNNLKIASHPGNVWKNIKIFKLNEENKARGLSMASAIGLALRAAENPLKE